MGPQVPLITNYLTQHFLDDAAVGLEGYERLGGYAALRRALENSPADLIELITSAGLQGRGGAGFSTGLKWSFMPADGELPKYLVCNGDESEPGSFKDRILMERGPHQLLEGILIAAWATGAEKTFLYVRGEYERPAEALERAIAEARARGIVGTNVCGSDFAHDIVVIRGAGAYICGEETGLLESLEGKKGQPRKKPPFPAQYGAFGRPTTVNNVETLCHVPHIVNNGADWFRGFGTEKSPGTTLFGVSGQIARPGLFELPLGTPLDELVFEHAGGPAADQRVKGVIPGGLSMPVLPADQLDVPMANEFLRERRTMLGTGGVMVMDERTCMVRASVVIAHFFRDESCGQCTQCREGTGWIHKLVERIERGAGVMEDITVLEDICAKMEGQTICAFADAAAWPIQGMLRHFRGEFEAHVVQRRCGFAESFEL
ncbi:MAG: NADH-quinone oxidoreductase subunit NuoF [Deltaproteobacteria bacterium]|nr:NADH-quinone oxidoreductase subunit NuoF [Deltaproteobacteria bacterium]MBW2360698.1 NADH-quinone oxidoreductase subunit NuoF [Deltaproteobacteria bacterium]